MIAPTLPPSECDTYQTHIPWRSNAVLLTLPPVSTCPAPPVSARAAGGRAKTRRIASAASSRGRTVTTGLNTVVGSGLRGGRAGVGDPPQTPLANGSWLSVWRGSPTPPWSVRAPVLGSKRKPFADSDEGPHPQDPVRCPARSGWVAGGSRGCGSAGSAAARGAGAEGAGAGALGADLGAGGLGEARTAS